MIWHFDPLHAILVLTTLIGIYRGWIAKQANLEKDSEWHTEWIKKHSKESDERVQAFTVILTKLEANSARLTTLTETHGERLARIEGQLDKKR